MTLKTFDVVVHVSVSIPSSGIVLFLPDEQLAEKQLEYFVSIPSSGIVLFLLLGGDTLWTAVVFGAFPSRLAGLFCFYVGLQRHFQHPC